MFVDLDESEAVEWAFRDNNPAGEPDDDLAAELLAELAGRGRALDMTGFAPVELSALLRRVAPVVDPDVVPEVPAVPRSVRGEVYELGRHRLMCGDARERDDYARLLGESAANMVFTSPPYASQREYDPASGFEPIHPDTYADWYAPIAENLAWILVADGSYFCVLKEHCDDGQRHLYATDVHVAHVREWGWRWVDTFCWRDTKNGVPGGWANRFKDAWEPVHHYALSPKIKVDHAANGNASDAVFAYSSETKKTGTGSGLLGEKATSEHRGIARPSNVVEVAASSASGHSATFPVDLPAWFIRAFSAESDVVFDPFLGSGSTLIAADIEGRVCYGLEISPLYCDVIRQRYADHVGDQTFAP